MQNLLVKNTKVLLKQVLFPQNFLELLSVLTAGISIFNLYLIGTNSSVGDVYRILIRTYDNLLGSVLEWVPEFAADILKNFAIEVSFHAYWDDLFILIFLYIMRDCFLSVQTAKSISRTPAWYRVYAISIASIGVLTALAMSLGAGLVDIGTGEDLSIFLVFVLPVSAFFIYNFIDIIGTGLWFRKEWDHYGGIEESTFVSFFVQRSFILIFFRVALPVTSLVIASYYFAGPSIFAVVVSLLAFLIYQALYQFAYEFYRGENSISFEDATNGYHFKLGAAILKTILLGLIFIVSNAQIN